MEFLLSFFGGGIIGSIVGVYLNNHLTNRRVLKEQKFQVLKDLMATKFSAPSDQRGAEAINYIPVLFSSKSDVIKNYEEFHSAAINDAKNRMDKFNDLIISIADDVGIKIHPTKLLKVPIISYELSKRTEDFYKQKIEGN